MAKFVIAGKSDCPYYARIELLADTLAKNLDTFRVHKIVKKPEEWDEWLRNTCEERKFVHKKSPVVWRELVDRGGKGILIGGANEFQEYTLGYYGIKSSQVSTDMKKIAVENAAFNEEIQTEIQHYKSLSKPMRVCITNASSNTCYHLLNSLSNGSIFGETTELSLNLLDTDSQLPYVRGCEMEALDMAYNLVREVHTTSNAQEALIDCEVVIILDQLDKQEAETSENWLQRVSSFYSQRAKLIDTYCKKNVKVLVVSSGPANLAVYMMHQTVINVSKCNIISIPMLRENQAKAIVAQKLKVKTSDVVDVIIWGDQENNYCDLGHARVHNHDGPIWGPPFYSRLIDVLIHEENWLIKEFAVELNARAIKEKTLLKKSPAFALAAAVSSVLRFWTYGSPDGQFFTAAVASEGWYSVPEGMVYNFPIKFLPDGKWTVVQDLEISPDCAKKIKESIEYLTEQIYVLYPDRRPAPPPQEKPSEAAEPVQRPIMSPIKEEADHDRHRQSDQTDSDVVTDTPTDADRVPSGLKQIKEDAETQEMTLPTEGAIEAIEADQQPHP